MNDRVEEKIDNLANAVGRVLKRCTNVLTVSTVGLTVSKTDLKGLKAV